MIESIFVAMTGMQGHERGLNVISNNITNMNTPAFRGSSVSFADVFSGTPQDSLTRPVAGQRSAGGGGLNASRTVLDLRRGDPQQTGEPLDLFLQGDGYFVLMDENGAVRYTRNGRFSFENNQLVDSSRRYKVMARNAAGQLVPVDINSLQVNPFKPTTLVKFDGNLSPDVDTTGGGSGNTERTKVVEPIDVFDQGGAKHTLKVTFTRDTTTPQSTGILNWKVTVSEGGLDIGVADLQFNGVTVLGSGTLQMNLALRDAAPATISFDLTTVFGQNLGPTAQSTLLFQRQDGFGPGAISGETFDENGVLKISYSNGQTVDGPRLATAQIRDEGGLQQVGDSVYEYRGTESVVLREMGGDVKVLSMSLELSNVDLTQEFSELILMQRGYQAASQVLSTANDMLQDLLQMRSGK